MNTCENCGNCEVTRSLFCGGSILYCSEWCREVAPGESCEDWVEEGNNE